MDEILNNIENYKFVNIKLLKIYIKNIEKTIEKSINTNNFYKASKLKI